MFPYNNKKNVHSFFFFFPIFINNQYALNRTAKSSGRNFGHRSISGYFLGKGACASVNLRTLMAVGKKKDNVNGGAVRFRSSNRSNSQQLQMVIKTAYTTNH